jgi:hypothetical protein
VQATCLRAIERADQFASGTRLDRWLFAILRSIWLNDIRAHRIRMGGGFVDGEEALSTDGAHIIETNILAAEALKAIDRLPEAQRETTGLWRRFHLRGSRRGARHSNRHGDEPPHRGAVGAGEIEIGTLSLDGR